MLEIGGLWFDSQISTAYTGMSMVIWNLGATKNSWDTSDIPQAGLIADSNIL